ncbi:MAG: glycogen/starch synthase, partial [Patescibacteria group bacterium]|nr:glycogen/starch synthase [Patescibacteria group bacterium]
MADKKIKVIFAGAELNPLAKVGGLADVLGSLPKALSNIGVEISIFLPFYGFLNKIIKAKLIKKSLAMEIEGREVHFDLYQTSLPDSKVKVFLVKHKIFFGKDIYLDVTQGHLPRSKRDLSNV